MEARFVAKIDKNGENGCWIWTASTRHGYGQFCIDGKIWKANRVAYKLWKGEIPDGLLVRHKCDVPTCVNPEHLEVGTQQDNMDDMVRAGRQNKLKGETNGGAKLTEAQVLDIRLRKGQTQVELAREFGISKTQICNIRNGKRWKHLKPSV